jgi:uroporphyrinogen-III synthase
MRLVVTRPIDEAERTAERLRARGHEVLIAPMLAIAPVSDSPPPAVPFDAILITSGNAPRMLSAHPHLAVLTGLPVFAVGRRTAQAARDAGFADVTSADGDAGDLARLVASRLGSDPGGARRRLLYLAGDDRARDLAGDLRPHGIDVETWVVYRALAARTLPAQMCDFGARRGIDGVLHFSQRTAGIFLAAAEAAGLAAEMRPVTHYCLSARVCEPLRAAGWPDIRIAPHPGEEALLDLIGSG